MRSTALSAFALGIAIGFGGSPSFAGQATGPGMGTHGSTAANGHTTLTGCLGQGLTESTYKLEQRWGSATEAKNAKKVEIVPSQGVELKSLIGREVKLTGRMEKANQDEQSPQQKRFVVDSAKKLSATCS